LLLFLSIFSKNSFARSSLDKAKNYLAAQPNVIEVHDLHVWAIGTSEIALTVNVVVRDGHPGNEFLCRIAEDLHDNLPALYSTSNQSRYQQNIKQGIIDLV